MDIYITDFATADTLRIPILPEKIQMEAQARFLSYDIASLGEIRLPMGEELSTFGWEGILPGELRKNEPYIKEWKSPKEIQGLFSIWRHNGHKLRLMITETPINHDVYLDNYKISYENGFGDYTYEVAFVQAKDLKISTVGTSNDTSSSNQTSDQRPSMPKSTTYTVKSGDTLWDIAQKNLGSGARYPEIASLNGLSNPNLIKVGQVLKLP